MSAGSAAAISPMPSSSRCQNSMQPVADRRAQVAPLGRAVRRVPGVPELVLDAVGGHQVEHEQVPVAPAHQEPDGLEVLVEEPGQVGEGLGLVAAVVDGGGPGAIRRRRRAPARRRGRGSLAKSGASAGLRKSPRKNPGGRAGRVAHRHAAGDGRLAVPAGDLPDQVGPGSPATS